MQTLKFRNKKLKKLDQSILLLLLKNIKFNNLRNSKSNSNLS